MASGVANMSMTLQYGPDSSNVGDLYLPTCPSPRVVALLHGGFWRMPHGRDQMSPIAEDLRSRGLAVWNIGYRRIGEPQVGWPEIASDVLAALAFLHEFNEREHCLDLNQFALIGHSAGGQLALACTSDRMRLDHPRGRPLRFRPAVVVALAAVTDLEAAFETNLGDGAARSLLGGTPSGHPDRYASASPHRLLPHGSKQLLLHGLRDEAVPISQSRRYARAARLAGDDVSCVELQDSGHMDFLDPLSSAHGTLCDRLLGSMGTAERRFG